MNVETQFKIIETRRHEGLVEIDLQIGPKTHRLYFRSIDLPLTVSREALVEMSLLPTMKTGGTLVVDGNISQRFFNAMWNIQDIYCNWEPSLHRVDLRNAIPVVNSPPKENRVGAFFSGGVDSFYTLLKHLEEITDLIFVYNFDTSSQTPSLLRKASETVRRIGNQFGKRVIEIDCNFYEFMDSYFRRLWNELTNGNGLTTVGHLLSPYFKRIYIPASHTYSDLVPLGSHPILDPLWNTETLEFVHDGCEARRMDKLALISKEEAMTQNLRVCFTPNPDGSHNCGQCEKCLRTMINLYTAGVPDRFTAAFDVPLDIKRVSKLVILDASTRAFIKENLEALEGRKDDRKLYRALLTVLNRPLWKARMIKSYRRIKGRLKRKIDHLLARLTGNASMKELVLNLTGVDAEGIHYNIPNTTYKKWKINSLGFRGKEIDLKKKDGCVRIICLGRSETFGYYESENNEWSAQLEEWLSIRFSPVEVLNASVVGLNIARNKDYVKKHILPLKPDVLIVYHSGFMMHMNRSIRTDSRPWTSQAEKSKPVPSLSERFFPYWAFSLFEQGVNNFVPGWWSPHIAGWKLHLKIKKKERKYLMTHQSPLDNRLESILMDYRTHLRSFVDYLKNNHVIPVLSTFPTLTTLSNRALYRDQLLASRYIFGVEFSENGILTALHQLNSEIKKMAEEQKVLLVDTDCLLPKTPEYFADNFHYTDKGAEAVARIFYHALMDNKLLTKHD